MKLTEKLKNFKLEDFKSKVKKPSLKTVLKIGLAGILLTGAFKDNVHFGSVTLNNPQENHYSIGIAPVMEIKGKAKGNFYSAGLLYGANDVKNHSELTGNISAYSLIVAVNNAGKNSELTGNMSSYGLIGSGNEIKKESELIGDMSGYSLMGTKNTIGENSKITGNMSAYGLIIGNNVLRNNSKIIKGNNIAKGFIADTSMDFGIGSNMQIGITNYTHQTDKVKK